MTHCIALLRGINVGRAEAVPMTSLRQVSESLGHTDVVTVLQSGNAVFDAATFHAIMLENPLAERASDPVPSHRVVPLGAAV